MPYRIGLPAWAFPGWRNTVFPDQPSMLHHYSRVFNAVEGNTTFYHVPAPDKIERWQDDLRDSDCRISFKLPREVTHQRSPDEAVLTQFLHRVAPLHSNLGPFLIQFPAWAGLVFLQRFERLFELVTDQAPAVVEVRHPELFKKPKLLEPLLAKHRLGRVMLDSRPLFQGDPSHPDVRQARHEKPELPVLKSVQNDTAFVRLILHPEAVTNERWISLWVKQTADWIGQGLVPNMMIHCPNNLYCPAFALDFHQKLQEKLRADQIVDMAALPPWPVPQQHLLL